MGLADFPIDEKGRDARVAEASKTLSGDERVRKVAGINGRFLMQYSLTSLFLEATGKMPSPEDLNALHNTLKDVVSDYTHQHVKK